MEDLETMITNQEVEDVVETDVLVPAEEVQTEKKEMSKLALFGIGAAIGAAGYGAYKLGKKAIGWIKSKRHKKSDNEACEPDEIKG